MIEKVRRKTDEEPGLFLRPYVWLFSSDGNDFVLDHHTNRVFALSPREAECIRLWIEGGDWAALTRDYGAEVAEIQKLRDEGLFCCRPPDGLAFGAGWDEIEAMIRWKRSNTVIEVTQQCNLRCTYCTFGGGFKDHRTHSPKSMSIDTLEEAVMAAIDHGVDMDSINIGFYGGEPLLRFDLVRHAVALARRNSAGKPLNFSITTNATLVKKESAEFLRNNDFSVLVSIDGPKHMHNRYRVYPSGKGSYQSAIDGLKILLNTYPLDMHVRIALNMCIPSIGWARQLQKLWNQEPWLPRGIRARSSVIDLPEGFGVLPAPEGATWQDIRKDWLESMKTGRADISSIISDMFNKKFAIIHQRQTFSSFRNNFFPNGCCIPAVRKIYVTVDGDYLICERAHGCPPIGNLRTGVNVDLIKQVVNDYTLNSKEDCLNCVAIANCSLCFNHAYEDGKFSLQRKRYFCESERRSHTRAFSDYCRLCKEQPQQIKMWESIKIV